MFPVSLRHVSTIAVSHNMLISFSQLPLLFFVSEWVFLWLIGRPTLPINIMHFGRMRLSDAQRGYLLQHNIKTSREVWCITVVREEVRSCIVASAYSTEPDAAGDSGTGDQR